MEGPKYIHTIEHSDNSEVLNHTERSVRKLETSVGNALDKNESLKKAQQYFLNPKLYAAFLKATAEKAGGRGVKGLSEIENRFVANLLDLTDEDIDSVIGQFNLGFKRFVASYNGEIPIDPELRRKIFENNTRYTFTKDVNGNIHPESIKSVIHFIRSRKKLLESAPETKYGFYCEEGLDSGYNIDIIECIFDDSNNVKEMNLIQVKSSIPDEESQKKIVKDHLEWVNSVLLDFSSFRKEYTAGLPEGLTIEEFSKNADLIEEILLDLVTSPDGFKAEDFLDRLDLGEGVTNKHKAWLLATFGAILREKIREVAERGIVEKEYVDEVVRVLDNCEELARKRSRLSRGISHIDSINSIIAVGRQIVHQENIFSQVEKIDNKKIIKIN